MPAFAGEIVQNDQGGMLERVLVDKLFARRRNDIASKCELMDLEGERRTTGQPGHFEGQLILGLVEDANVRDVKHSGQTNEILQFVGLSFAQGGRREGLHHASIVLGQVDDVRTWQTAVQHERMWGVDDLGGFFGGRCTVLLQTASLLFAHRAMWSGGVIWLALVRCLGEVPKTHVLSRTGGESVWNLITK